MLIKSYQRKYQGKPGLGTRHLQHLYTSQQPRSQDVGGTPKNQRGKAAVHQGPRTETPTHRALEQKMANNCCSQEPRTVGLCPREASLVQMERGAERGTLGTGGCGPGTTTTTPNRRRPLTWREMSQRALGSSSLGFLCGFRFCCHLRGQAVCGAAGNNCKNQNQIHLGWRGSTSKCACSFGTASAFLSQSFVQKQLWGPLPRGRRREGPSWADPPGGRFTTSHPTPTVRAHAHTEPALSVQHLER